MSNPNQSTNQPQPPQPKKLSEADVKDIKGKDIKKQAAANAGKEIKK